VGVACGRDTGADVEELANSCLSGEVVDHPPEERPVRPRGETELRPYLERFLGGGPVRSVVVLAAEQVVIDPGMVRLAGVERRCCVVGHFLMPLDMVLREVVSRPGSHGMAPPLPHHTHPHTG